MNNQKLTNLEKWEEGLNPETLDDHFTNPGKKEEDK